MEFLKPRLLIISAPSGSGKTSIFKRAKSILPDLTLSISFTTRRPREGESHGTDYFFIESGEFKKMIETGDFIEWAEVFGQYYGTSRHFIRNLQNAGKITVLDIDVQGAMQLKRTDLDAVFIFIKPPSLEELSNRLISRGTETKEALTKRLGHAEHEISFQDRYDYVIVNDILEEAVNRFLKIVIKECGNIDKDDPAEIDKILTRLTTV